jgi:hypothetical protein
MKTTSKSSNAATKKMHKPIFVEIGTEEKNSRLWVSINSSDSFPLTPSERERGKEKKKDLEKMQLVKELLLKGLKPNQIYKQTGISRNTVYEYKKLLDESTLNAITKVHLKYTQSTLNSNILFFIPLSISNLESQSTLLAFYVFLLLSLFIGVVIYNRLEQYRKTKEAHRLESDALWYFFQMVLKYKFDHNLIISPIKGEVEYFRDMYKEYGTYNSEQDNYVRHIKQTESNDLYEIKIQLEIECYEKNYRTKIRERANKGKVFFQELKESGKLDYFDFSKRDTPGFQESKEFLLQLTEKARKRPHPLYGHKYDNNFST